MTIELTNAELESLNKIFSYIEQDERRDYEEFSESYSEEQNSHIYNDVVVLGTVIRRAEK